MIRIVLLFIILAITNCLTYDEGNINTIKKLNIIYLKLVILFKIYKTPVNYCNYNNYYY